MKEMLKTLIQVANTSLHIPREEMASHVHDYRTYPPLLDMATKLKAVGLQSVPLGDIEVSDDEYRQIIVEVYGGGIGDPGETRYLENYVQSIRDAKPNDDVNAEDADSMLNDVETIFKRIESVAASGVNQGARAYGLVVGRVQSGKTRNYIGLALKAYEAGWDTVLVLTSNNTALAGQTRDRMRREFEKVRCRATYLDFLKEVPREPWSEDGRFYGVAQKEKTHLLRINDWLNSVGDGVGRQKVLVVDDESDNATPDRQQNNTRLLNETDVRSLARQLSHGGHDPVAEWIGKLEDFGRNLEKTAEARGIDIDAARQELSRANTRISILNALRDERGSLCRLLELDREVDVDGQRRKLSELVTDRLGNAADGGHPVENWKTLSGLVFFVLDVCPTRSCINRLVTQLFSREEKTRRYSFEFAKMAYVGYTATPFANMLNERPEDDPLASDFMYPLASSRHYLGLEEIFGPPMRRNDVRTRMDVVRDISSEQNIIDAIRNLDDGAGTESVGVSPDLTVGIQKDETEVVNCEWSTLKNAVAYLFCSAASRRYWRKLRTSRAVRAERANRWTTMLFSIDSDTWVHAYQRQVLSTFLDLLGNPEHRDVRMDFLSRCKEVWHEETVRFSHQDFLSACPHYGSEVSDCLAWNDILGDVEWFLDRVANDNRVHVRELNCTTRGAQGLNDYVDADGRYAGNDDDHIWIICGGHKVSRGLTLDGLTVTYFDRVRNGSCVDTLEQMGRWFGFREGYELLPRIWMNAGAIVEFKRMAKIESVMHGCLKEDFNAYPEYTPKDKGHYARIMRFGRDLSGRTAAELNRPAEGGAEDTFNTMSLTKRRRAMSVLRKFVGNLEAHPGQLDRPLERYQSQHAANGENGGEFHDYPYWRDVSPAEVRGFLSELSELAPTVRAKDMFDALAREIVTREWDVVIANPKSEGPFCTVDRARRVAVRMSCPKQYEKDGDAVTFPKVTGDNFAFYSGVETQAIVKTEVEILKGLLADPLWSPTQGADRDSCQVAVERAETSRFVRMLPPAVRRAAGVTRMSSDVYRDNVFKNVQALLPNPRVDRPNPILQISLLQPPQDLGVTTNGDPFVCVSFYWPEHDATRYIWASVGFGDDEVDVSIPTETIAEAISSVLDENSFLSEWVLKPIVEKMIGSPDISEPDFERALEDSRADCQHLRQDTAQLLAHTWYSGKWWRELHADDGNLTACDRVREQLEIEARDFLEMVRCPIPPNVFNGAMTKQYPLRMGIVFPDSRGRDNFDGLFTEMVYARKLTRINLSDRGWIAVGLNDDDMDFDW